MRPRTRIAASAALVSALLATSACANIGLEPAPPAEEGMIAEIRMPSEAAGSVQGILNYNWLSPNATVQTWLFEPLMIRDRFTCEAIPWLATSYEWTTPDRMVIDLRQGVEWSDGEAFTADDVVYSFMVGKEFPAADRAGLWGEFFGAAAETVTALDDHTVEIQFAGAAVPKTDAILSTMRILPEHIYAEQGDPTLYVDEVGVGTGPFVPKDYNGRRLVMERNPNYWAAEDVKIQQISLEGQYDANSGALKLRGGALDMYRGDIPNPNRSVVAPDPENAHFFYPPDATTVLAINNERPVLNDPKFREAFAYAIDREAITERASFGIMEPASQTMLLLPYQEQDIPEKWSGDKAYIPYDPDQANEKLDAAGYEKNADGWRVDDEGKPLSFVFSVQAGWMDIIAMADVIVRNAKDVGVQVKMVTTDPNAVDGMQRSGDFDMVVDFVGGGCQRARDLGGRLQSSQISKDKDLLLNRARYSSPEVDALVDEWANVTDEGRAQEIEEEIIDVFMTEFPYIALQYAPSRLIYRTENAVGWPSEEDPYPIDQVIRLATELRPAGDAAASGED
ncbi:ABC transporter substrate-binding protein [Microbacterium sp. EYE_5]|uniref:ABC transporter substrate-binding protein n=1 Tax=unclassified Microbacterium TaxID=2609290 RepID=UPI0020041980|nr:MULTISPECIES: ABC transporter substrate-binding protein [unclassified Microbacterium]MCK6079480.1 ABC transporter substrate-binding protein [Microbacterium sp. EYE_382]MCK6084750.1 ABC transporter substrate-binding protein [Microbacterium sp. EYE_384]MCK6123023.1 ABC transporter substrate-binding protein [Microbacterium sp. EYE_80]MCK6125514.1 ABC transporter substrate-binding protein [Microbacterium sp. EYE_79]MCK6140434.1 ABC transporter substrate-binding protein [Microbacterium sp. EYE_3